jgi:drug/metabolite transporter (DMT)-like permease
MAYTYLVPVWVIAWEFVLGAEWPPVMILPGIALIVLALVAMLRAGASTRRVRLAQ